MASSMSGSGLRPPRASVDERVRPVNVSSAQNARRHQNFLGRAIGASRDLLRNTRSVSRREYVSELASTTIEPRAWPKPPNSPAHAMGHDGEVPLAKSEAGANTAMDFEAAVPDVPLPPGLEHEIPSFHRTRPLSPEGGARIENMPGSRSQNLLPIKDGLNPLSLHPPSSLKKPKTTFNIPQASSTQAGASVSRAPTGAGTSHAPMEVKFDNPLRPRPHPTVRFPSATANLIPSRPEIPTRKDSLPAERRVLQDLVDQTVRSGDFCDSRQSVTAYVSAEYSSDLTHVSTLSMTSWLSDPDGPPDDLVSWNQPATARRDSVTAVDPSESARPQVETLLAPPRPSLAPRSKSSPIYSNVMAPQEQSDARYERILREKLRHHAAQVKKRLDTSTYYSPTVRQGEIEVHLAFVRAAEEILKQSPIWYGSSQAGDGGLGGGMDEGARIRYLLQV